MSEFFHLVVNLRSDQCLRPYLEENCLGFAKVPLGETQVEILHASAPPVEIAWAVQINAMIPKSGRLTETTAYPYSRNRDRRDRELTGIRE